MVAAALLTSRVTEAQAAANLLQRGLAEFRAGELERAENTLREAIQTSPGQEARSSSRFALARVLRSAGRTSEAIEVYEQFLRESDMSTPEVRAQARGELRELRRRDRDSAIATAARGTDSVEPASGTTAVGIGHVGDQAVCNNCDQRLILGRPNGGEGNELVVGGIVLLVASALSVVSAAVLYGTAVANADAELDARCGGSQCSRADQVAQETFSRRQAFAVTGDALVLGGGLTAGVGIVLVLRGELDGSNPPSE